MTATVTEDAPQTLYRFFGAEGELLYVGITLNPGVRMNEHRGSRWWDQVANVTLEPFETREAVARAERLAIANENPRFNVQHKAPAAGPSSVRTFRVSDELWGSTQDVAWSRRETVSDAIRQGLAAYSADPEAFGETCAHIIEDYLRRKK